jgi:Uma2 family endonuclease
MGASETLQRRKLSVDDFHRMGEAGILGEDDRIELIETPLYARHGVAEVWLVDLQSESVIMHRQPAPEGYRDVSTATSDAVISPLELPSVRLDLAELWRI